MRVPPWEGDWKARLAERLAEHGFATISAFADSRPGTAPKALADELGRKIDAGESASAPPLAGDLAPVQLIWALLDEAKAGHRIEQRARDLFVRGLRDALPKGWPPARGETTPETRKPLGVALILWSGDIRSHLPEYAATVNAAADALLTERSIPVGWLPTSVDDPLLIELFRRHWREPSDEMHSTAIDR